MLLPLLALTAFVLLALFIVLLHTEVYRVSTPELFGNGTMYLVHSQDRMIGYISAWGGWLIVGSGASCEITQLFGLPIGGAEGAVRCHMNFSKPNRFAGWIDFRGHLRKFCGADQIDHMPLKCYGE